MNRTFELKKKYPGIRKNIPVGEVFREDENSYVNTSSDIAPFVVPKHSVENDDGEFWEEVTGAFEVVSLWGKNNENVHEVRGGKVYAASTDYAFGKASWGENDPIKYITNFPEDWSIYSIKRLSDGQVFTIGDYITGSEFNDPRKITRFDLSISGNQVYLEEEATYTGYDGKVKLKNANFIGKDLPFEIVDVDHPTGDIYSVERLSDGKIFSIGDTITPKEGTFSVDYRDTGKGEIESIALYQGKSDGGPSHRVNLKMKDEGAYIAIKTEGDMCHTVELEEIEKDRKVRMTAVKRALEESITLNRNTYTPTIHKPTFWRKLEDE